MINQRRLGRHTGSGAEHSLRADELAHHLPQKQPVNLIHKKFLICAFPCAALQNEADHAECVKPDKSIQIRNGEMRIRPFLTKQFLQVNVKGFYKQFLEFGTVLALQKPPDDFALAHHQADEYANGFMGGRGMQAVFKRLLHGLAASPFQNIHDVLKMIVKGLPADPAGILP